MKKMRRLIPAIAMLLVSAVMLSTASFAWFTMGTQATATGMSVKAEAASSLLIVNKTKAGNDVALAFQTASNVAEFDASTISLKPATKASSDVTSSNGLMTLEDATKVDTMTGKTTTGAKFVAATSGVNFIDYEAYIASAGVAINDQVLTATVSLLKDGLGANINNAITIAFWVADSSSADHTDTEKSVNLLTASKNAEGATVTLKENIDIPAAFTNEQSQTTAGYIKVIMRVYFDGDLADEAKAGYTYVRNDQISLTSMGFDIRFDIKPVSTGS